MQAAALILALHGSVMAAEKPARIVSTNVCTDQLLLLLAERSRIAAVSNLAGDASLSNLAAAAKDVPRTGGRAEEIVPLRPDLVLANAWTGAKANRFLAGLGIRVLVVPEAKSFEEIAQVLALVGAELGEPERAAALVRTMQDRLSAARRSVGARSALIYEPNGYTPSAGTLSDAVLTAAGWRNHAKALGVATYGSVALERVVMTPPDLFVFDDHAPSTASRAQALLHHPALKAAAQSARVDWMPSRLWICAGPWTVQAVERLAQIEPRS
jgi:iron complex transport system substrate-binding protein